MFSLTASSCCENPFDFLIALIFSLSIRHSLLSFVTHIVDETARCYKQCMLTFSKSSYLAPRKQVIFSLTAKVILSTTPASAANSGGFPTHLCPAYSTNIPIFFCCNHKSISFCHFTRTKLSFPIWYSITYFTPAFHCCLLSFFP